MERVHNYRFLGVDITEDLTWGVNTTGLVKKAQQRLYFLRLLRKNNIPQKLLLSFYHCSIDSILTYCLCVWFPSCTVALRKRFQGVIKAAQKIIGCPLPSLEEVHSARCLKQSHAILKDSSHPGHKLFELLPSGKRFRSLKTRTNRLQNSFYPTAIKALNCCYQSSAHSL